LLSTPVRGATGTKRCRYDRDRSAREPVMTRVTTEIVASSRAVTQCSACRGARGSGGE
jgi:hypothetical protein